jgi:hypothetical protein
LNAPVLADGRYLVVVRRGESPLLFSLAHVLECAENVNVIQDRRVGERRSRQEAVSAERRARDRRQTGLGKALAFLAPTGT